MCAPRPTQSLTSALIAVWLGLVPVVHVLAPEDSMMGVSAVLAGSR